MLQAYSSNIEITANTAIPFNNVVLDKGCGETMSGVSSILLNQRGVYLVEFDGYATPDAATLVSAQLYVNGIAQPQAISSFMGTAVTATDSLAFKTLIQVNENNCNCNCYSSPTVIQVMLGETAVSDAHVNIIVTKIR